MQISEIAEHTTSIQLTLSLEVFPARMSAMPEPDLELTESAADCGVRCGELLANYDHAMSSWRTSQLCLDGEWAELSGTWPQSGMTRNGQLYPLLMWEHRTSENESGLWPTPTAMDAQIKSSTPRPSRVATNRQTDYLARMVHWSTPDTKGFTGEGAIAKLAHTLSSLAELRGMTYRGNENYRKKYWPTANSRDWKDTPGMTKTRKDGKSRKDQLARRVYCEEEIIEKIGTLNPTWVEWLMGFPLGWTELKDLAMPRSRKSRK